MLEYLYLPITYHTNKKLKENIIMIFYINNFIGIRSITNAYLVFDE